MVRKEYDKYIVSDFNEIYKILKDDYIPREYIYLRKDGAGLVKTRPIFVSTIDNKNYPEDEEIIEIQWGNNSFMIVYPYDAIDTRIFLSLKSGKEFELWAVSTRYVYELFGFFGGAKIVEGEWILNGVNINGLKTGQNLEELYNKLRDLNDKVIKFKAIYGVNKVRDLYNLFGRDVEKILRDWGFE